MDQQQSEFKLQQTVEQLQNAVTDNVDKLLDNFVGIMRAAQVGMLVYVEFVNFFFVVLVFGFQIHDELQNTRENYQIDVHASYVSVFCCLRHSCRASNIGNAIESMLLLIRAMKQHYLLFDENNVAKENHALL